MNQINPRKLRGSKWTAVTPRNKEKHFLVSDVEYDEEGSVTSCTIEAVMSKNEYPINWRELKKPEIWRQGWK
ncbi:TIGR02450 family Trp-rich protein [Shewanella corallii]|uniref:TIGR02450 family Trp-rich protein n=1 Tax=Shewanella corallii TaxID=560080 RepID=A0ABT0N357_9GAMM|nr:TIGR02450 family Trp-rich protein [Shewanella corallii]MCL2912882.1 TIGR02450 family Trp-rich protein [Shewanella corallii]